MSNNAPSESTINSSQFQFRNNQFIGSMSILGDNFRFETSAEGTPSFYVESTRTGEIRKFTFVMADRNAQNETTALFFRCADPHCRHLEAKLFND